MYKLQCIGCVCLQCAGCVRLQCIECVRMKCVGYINYSVLGVFDYSVIAMPHSVQFRQRSPGVLETVHVLIIHWLAFNRDLLYPICFL